MSTAASPLSLQQLKPPRGAGAFSRKGVTVASWYCVGWSSALRAGRVISVMIGESRVAMWRGEGGRAQAIGARCPHLGADLTQGRVDAGRLICPMHAWTFGHGACERGMLPTSEEHGLLYVHTGSACVVDRAWVSSPDGGACEREGGRPWLLPPQTIRASGHLVLGNGFDTGHYGPLHGVELIEAKRVLEDETCVYGVDICARLVGKQRWSVLGLRGAEVRARFVGVGAGLTWVAVAAPVRFSVLFSATPLAAARGGGCRTRVAFFPPIGSMVTKLRALGLMYGLVCDDRRVLEGMRFHPNWTAADSCLRGYAEMIDGLPLFEGAGGEGREGACG